MAAVSGIEALQKHTTEIHCLQDLHPKPLARKAAGAAVPAPQEAPARRASSRETKS
jgi:hypothetical protein